METIKTRVKEYRKSTGYSFDDIASMTGVSRATLSRIERGEANPTYKTIKALLDFFEQEDAE